MVETPEKKRDPGAEADQAMKPAAPSKSDVISSMKAALQASPISNE